MNPHVYIIGIGDDGLHGLTESARQTVLTADTLLATSRLLEGIPDARGERLAITGDLEQLVASVAARQDRQVVVLTTGDPLFYGVARFLCDRLGKERFEVVPHVSSMQLAFARVKESWEEAYLANLATVPLARVVEKVRSATKAGLFTTEEVSPADVAAELLRHDIDYFEGYVCENLGSPDECVTRGELAEIAAQRFGELNVVILVRKPNVPDRPAAMVGHRMFGNPDELFLQTRPKRGLLTPAEVRAIALAELDLGRRSIVWDVGAGSGSVSIESAMIAAEGHVYAIEMDPGDHELIRENADRFGVSNVFPTLGHAPEVWSDLPTPDAIFIGGTGRSVSRIAEQACERLRHGGRMVVNVNSIENLDAVRAALQKLCSEVTVRMINLAVTTDQMESTRFESRHPTFLISAVKPTG
jgi:precorrin-6Y C5,15-methyltransferase (decarboxylating)